MSVTKTLKVQLRGVFGDRLQSLLAFEPIASPAPADGLGPVHTLAVVDRLSVEDLTSCASLSAGWKRLGLEMPLFLAARELSRSLDVFPLEFSAIIASRRLIDGTDPFESLTVAADDLRRACEVQAKSHLLHLREGYLEASGRRHDVAKLVAASVPPFTALLLNLARLEGGSSSTSTAGDRFAGLPQRLEFGEAVIGHLRAADRHGRVKGTDEASLYADYLRCAERIADYVDQWKH